MKITIEGYGWFKTVDNIDNVQMEKHLEKGKYMNISVGGWEHEDNGQKYFREISVTQGDYLCECPDRVIAGLEKQIVELKAKLYDKTK